MPVETDLKATVLPTRYRSCVDSGGPASWTAGPTLARKSVLFIDPDARLIKALGRQIARSAAGIQVHSCHSGTDGLALALKGSFDVIVLEPMLPGCDGFDLVKRIRSAGLQTPVIICTTHASIAVRLHGLRLGADDFLAKPCVIEELEARVQVQLRHSRAGHREEFMQGLMEVDQFSRTVHINGKPLKLTQREYLLLHYLVACQGRVISQAELLVGVWGLRFDPGTNLVAVCIQRVRRKLKDVQAGDWIETVRGQGYRIRAKGNP